MAQNILLRIKGLTVTVRETGMAKTLVEEASLEIPPLTITALVGGSGSGKTTTGLALLRLLPPGLGVPKGEIVFDGRNLLEVQEEDMRLLRGREISMIFQEPLHAFNPVFTIGCQIDEVLRFHTPLSRRARQERVGEILERVGFNEPRRIAGRYPHQLSGGMRQRAMIAQAIAAGPRLIVADEPTSNLDVTLQARIIELFMRLKEEMTLSILLITHDLNMVARMADHVAVMAQGRIVESGAVKEILGNPQHDYTRRLLEASA